PKLPSHARRATVDPEPGSAVHSSALDGNRSASLRIQALQRTYFWQCEKAFAILTGDRRVWFEAASSDQLTLRPPHGITTGIDLIRGHFVPSNGDRPSHYSEPLVMKED